MDDKVRESLTAIGGHLQDLHIGQSQTVRELGGLKGTTGELQEKVGELQTTVGKMQTSVRNLETRAVASEATMLALTGTFASLEIQLTGLFSGQSALEKKVDHLTERVEKLERKAS